MSYIFFLDDTAQSRPSLPNMGKMIGIGGFCIPIENIQTAINAINSICTLYSFPKNDDEFKWSPSKKHWMRENLTGNRRESFFHEILKSITTFEITCIACLEDITCRTATGCFDHQEDIFSMILEKYEMFLSRKASTGLIVVDRSSGNVQDDETFLQRCFYTIQDGTKYIRPKNILFNVLTTSSHLNRLLQVADLIIGITCARTCHNNFMATRLFNVFRANFDSYLGSIGNIGLKIHPKKYTNLYHWILNDSHYRIGSTGYPFPLNDFMYSNNPYNTDTEEQ